ncbi:MAG: DUF305 domain-containing protein [Gemmatimonadales bacterium]|nr:DUF305 domain-containing protein [Gemmatimonadales bacterium]
MTPSPARSHTATLAAALALALAACSGAPRSEVQTSPQPATAAQGDVSATAKARADSARYPYTEADVRFMSAMVGHHSQAIEIAGWAPTHGAGPTVRTLAERIINGQQDEIVTMQQWLRDRGKPVPEPGRMGAHGTMHRSGHPHLMPGMLTDEQMGQLNRARGSEFDRLFLRFMIQHHGGAVAMVKELFGSYGAAQDETVFKFANDVNVDQTTEIARMETMLAALPAESNSP